MGRVVRALCLVALLAVTGLTAVTAYDNEITSAGFVDVRDGPCYSCHVTWSPVPLREMAAIIPGTGIEAKVGETFDYNMRVQDAWLSEVRPWQGGGASISASLDISDAPSLEFASDRAPTLGQVTKGAIAGPDAEEPTAQRTAEVHIQVEPGVTDLKIRLEPDNRNPTTGPDLQLAIYPNSQDTDGNPDIGPRNEQGPGAGEVYHEVGGAAISQRGFGNWIIEAVLDTTPGSPPALGTVPFTVIVDKYYNTTGETLQFIGWDGHLQPDQSQTFSWALRAKEVPSADESITIAANVTAFYLHDATGTTVDWSYTHHRLDVPVVPQESGGVSFDSSTVVFVEADKGGVSMSRISEVVGYVSTFLILLSIYTGGMFGKSTRRGLNKVFGSAKRRVAYHNFLSYGIILFATIHMVIFLIPGLENNFHWTHGLIWGMIGVLCMFGLGVTGAIQVPMIRRWNYAIWRWTHFGLSIGTIVFTLVHILLDGANFGEVQSAFGWENPLDPRDTT